jgi:uncharacterized protein (TIGR02452 family)
MDIRAQIRESERSTKYFGSNSSLSKWAITPTPISKKPSATQTSILQITTIDAARLLQNTFNHNPQETAGIIGVLNFASATKPGGGFKNGAEAQEESIARSSTLYATLTTPEATKFYDLHKSESSENNAAFYSHGMVYSPKVLVFRDDDGLWTPHFEIDVLTCAAVNAGEILKNTNGVNNPAAMVNIEKEMMERMGRILCLFEQKGARNIVLGTFGTGVFKNDVATVTRIWAQLLILPTARFRHSFDRVIFAVTGDTTYNDFKSGFEAWGEQKPAPRKPAGLSRRHTALGI